jgi:hypothetical protein
MLTDNERHFIKHVFEQDGRPWPKLGPGSPRLMGEYFAHAVLDDKTEAEALADEVRALGFDVTVRERVMRSDSLDQVIKAGHFILAIAGGAGGAIVTANLIVKAINELPEGVRKLRDKLRGSKARLELHEAFDLAAINSWLDANLGTGAWRYDPGRVEIKPLMNGGLTIFSIPEEVTGRTILLAVSDGTIEEEVTQLKRLGPKSDS